MSRMTAEHPLDAVTRLPGTGRRPRVLILRSCRSAQFADALRFARQRHPDAEIIALSHRGHRNALLASGVDRVIEIRGRRFSALRMAPWTLRRLRLDTFDDIIIPQMTAVSRAHLNLYWLAVALRSPRVTVLAAEQAPREFSRRGFTLFVRMQAFGWLIVLFDRPAFLALLVAACMVPRRRRRVAPDGRRRVLHIVPGCAGTDTRVQLAQLITRTPADRYHVEVLLLGHDAEFPRHWLERDVQVRCVEYWPRMTRSALAIRKRCRAREYDIVHTWLFMAGIVGAAGARLAGVPRVVVPVPNTSRRERKWWYASASALASSAADVVTVNVRAMMPARRTRTGDPRIELVPDGLDPSQFLTDRRGSRQRLLDLTRAPDNAVLVGIVGPLAYETDHVTFLRLLARVRKSRPDVHGVVIGDGDRRAHLQLVAGKLGLSSDVTFLSERPDARTLMAGLDLFLLTSREETCRDVLLQAAFLGVPCVATDIGGNPDVLDSAELLFAPGDIWTGSARVLALLDAPSEAARRAERTRQRALMMFTAERTAAAWLDLYERCPEG